MQQFPQRRSIRLPGFDYSQANYYFATICTYQRHKLFGDIVEGKMHLNDLGKIVEKQILKTPIIRKECEIDKYIIMPNHIHLIFIIKYQVVGASGRSPENSVIREATRASGRSPENIDTDNVTRANSRSPLRMPSRSVSSFVAGFKSASTKCINQIRNTPAQPVWQRNYYEHVISDDNDYAAIWEYIDANPDKWESDRNFG